jgi:murein L,D-transpeptidase YafK
MKKIICLLFLLLSCFPDQAPANVKYADKVVVSKKKRLLLLLKNGEVLKKYRIAIGRNPVGPKSRRGDGKTPEGEYVLDGRNPHSRFYRSIHISYPNPNDIDRAEKNGVAPGSDIMIHGLPRHYEDVGELHTVTNWTRGCIAVTNAEIDEIWSLVQDGTPIEIRP